MYSKPKSHHNHDINKTCYISSHYYINNECYSSNYICNYSRCSYILSN